MGSVAIRELGLLNEQANEAVFGIPHPGTFVLNADGTVRSKRFYPSYRERDTGIGVLEHLLGVEAADRVGVNEQTSSGVMVRASLDKDSYAWGQRIWLTVELDIPDGLHVYARPTPEGYFLLNIALEAIERVEPGLAQFPESRPFRVAGLDESFDVFEGRVRVDMPVTFMLVDGGAIDLLVNVSFQTCSETECLMPESVRLVLPISEQSLVERPIPRT